MYGEAAPAAAPTSDATPAAAGWGTNVLRVSTACAYISAVSACKSCMASDKGVGGFGAPGLPDLAFSASAFAASSFAFAARISWRRFVVRRHVPAGEMEDEFRTMRGG